MILIGESINSTRRGVGEAVSRRDAAFLVDLARRQVAAGADALDVNVAVAEGDETENLVWAVETVQAAVEVPLALDSRRPEALAAALEIHRGRAILNSISAEERHVGSLMPLAAAHGCEVILLPVGDGGVPKTAQERFDLSASLVDQAVQAGIASDRVFVDPLVMAVGSDWRAPKVALDALRLVQDGLPHVRTVAGVTNVSFGMPRRSLLNRTLLAMALSRGLDAILVNVTDDALLAVAITADTLLGNDPYCSAYLDAYRAGGLDG